MHFILLGYDGTDDKALERRMAVRGEHLEVVKEKFANGEWLYAAGILDDAGKMIGSMVVCEYASRDEMNKKWLENEPYVKSNVWEKVIVQPADIPKFLSNKS